MSDRISSEIGMFGSLINAMGGGGNAGNAFPVDDANELTQGARFIPDEVTVLRRQGKRVVFNNTCTHECCWFWLLPDGSKIYHYHDDDYQDLKNNHSGVCPECGNKNIAGGKN